MFTVFLAGGIGSGKSTVAQELERLGAARIDLDQLSRDVLAPGSPLLPHIAQAFGDDLLDAQTGTLNRGLLAQRAFATPQSTALLEELELPAIRDLLVQRLDELSAQQDAPQFCVVEVPLLHKVGEALDVADEVLAVCCPYPLRRARAIARGMTAEDVDARAANQPSEAWLRAHATSVIENDGTLEDMKLQAQQWYEEHVMGGNK